MPQSKFSTTNSKTNDAGDTSDLGVYLEKLKRNWLLLVLCFSSVFAVSAIYAFTRKPIYQADGLIVVQGQSQAGLAGLGALAGGGGFGQQANALNTQIEIFKTEPVIESTLKKINANVQDQEDLVDVSGIIKNLSISSIPRTDLIQISYRSSNPEQAVNTVNALMNSYIDNGIRLSRVQKTATRRFVESQLPKAEEEFLISLERFKIFREQSGAIALDAQTTQLVTKISATQQRVFDLQVQIQSLESSQQDLAQLLGNSALEARDLAALAESTGVQQAIADVQKLESQLAALRARYQANHPQILALQKQEAAQEQVLANRIEEVLRGSTISEGVSLRALGRGSTDLTLLRQQVTNALELSRLSQGLEYTQGVLSNDMAEFNKLPDTQNKAARLQLEIDANRARYTSLLTALQNAQLSENQDFGNATIVQQGILLKDPVSPNIPRILVLGAVLGILLGISIIWLRQQIDQTVRSEDEVKSIYNFSFILGSIPNLKQFILDTTVPSHSMSRAANLVVRDTPKSPASEAYRMLLTNLHFSNPDHKSLKLITVTSGMPGEGKSTTVANLALAMSELGSKVLIIDADMRKPSQHEIWQIPNRFGLSNILVEDKKDFQDIINHENDYLSILTAGTVPPNPTTLLNSQSFVDLIQELSEYYDHILLDAPPLTVAADALILGKVSNSLVLVARPNVLTRPVAVKAKESIQNSSCSVLGIVLNGVENSSNLYYYHHYDDTLKPNFLKNILKR